MIINKTPSHYSIVLNFRICIYGAISNVFRPVFSHLQGNNSFSMGNQCWVCISFIHWTVWYSLHSYSWHSVVSRFYSFLGL